MFAAEIEEVVKKPRITIEEMLEYLESQGIQCKGNNYSLIKNLHKAVRAMRIKPNANFEYVSIQSQSTLSAVEMAKTVDILMEGINKRIRGFDSVGAHQTSMKELLQAIESHKYFSDKLCKLNDLFIDIVRDAVSKKIVDENRLPCLFNSNYAIAKQ